MTRSTVQFWTTDFKGRETKLVNDLERATHNKCKNTEHLASISIFLERIWVFLKHFKCCITKQGLDSLAPAREQSSAHYKVTLPKNQNCQGME